MNVYKSMLDICKDAVFLSYDNKFIYGNRKALELLKLDSIDELINKSSIDIVHPSSLSVLMNRTVFSAENGLVFSPVDIQFVCKDGSVSDVEISSSSITRDNKMYIVTIATEIKPLEGYKQMESKREAIINSIFNSTIDGLLVSNLNGDITNVNVRFYDMFDTFRDQVQQLTECSLISFVLSKLDKPESMKWNDNILKSFVNVYFDDLRLKDGRVLSFYLCPLILEGEITGHLWSFRDITKQAELESELQKSNFELKEMLEKLKLTQAQLIQQEKFAGIGHLAAGIAHEINNPLGYVISNHSVLRDYARRYQDLLRDYEYFAEVVVSTVPNELLLNEQLDISSKKRSVSLINEDINDLLDDCLDGLNRVSNIVAALRSFSREYSSIEFSAYNINRGIEDTLIIVNNEIADNVRINKQLMPVSDLFVNGMQINQVILNIITNSLQAIKTKQPDDGIINISTFEEDRYVVCEIEDNGIGIKDDVISNIFTPFFTTKAVNEGKGLGLSIAYDIVVNKHAGIIDAESNYGTGTKIIVKLPKK